MSESKRRQQCGRDSASVVATEGVDVSKANVDDDDNGGSPGGHHRSCGADDNSNVCEADGAIGVRKRAAGEGQQHQEQYQQQQQEEDQNPNAKRCCCGKCKLFTLLTVHYGQVATLATMLYFERWVLLTTSSVTGWLAGGFVHLSCACFLCALAGDRCARLPVAPIALSPFACDSLRPTDDE